MFRRFSTIAIAAAMLLTASCTRENLVGNDPENDGMLKFCLSMSGSPASVLETKSASISTDDGTVSLPLSYERRDGIESRMPAAVPVTKGTQYNSAEQYEGSDGPAFSVVAWNSDGTPFIEDATEVTFTSNKWTPASSYKWEPEKDVKTFLAWANAPASGASVNNALIEGVATQTFTYTVPTDARQQNDVMLGWYKGNGGESMTAEITMVHPLTAIQFKQGEMDMSVTAIRSISIEGLLKTGEATVTYASAGSQVTPSYSWVPGSEIQKVTLAKKPEAESLEVDHVSSVIGEPFIVLPQKVLADKVKLSVVLSIGGTDRTLTAYLPAMDLKEGQTNVFTIGYKLPYNDGSLPGEFSVSPTKKVRFSPGNLYCNSTEFKFESNQYDYRTFDGCKSVINGIEGTTRYEDWGLMAWSTPTSNWGMINPITSSTLIEGNFRDWGQNIGDGKTWRTLSSEEMVYLLYHNKWGQATIQTGKTNVTGTVIVPEGWINPSGCSLTEGTSNGYNTNTYTLSEWQEMQNNGAVFFPTTGFYFNGILSDNGTRELYWSSSTDGTTKAHYFNADEELVGVTTHERYFRIAVRLVTDVDKPDPSKVEFIDLGLPSGTLWANMNIGAKSETEIGDYFAWGETEARGADWATSKPYTWTNAPFNNGSSSYNSTYFKANKSNWLDGNTLKPEYDAAHVAYGGDSYMPTATQIQELLDNTYITCIEETGLGYYLWKFTSKSDDKKYIYIPCGGWRDGSTLKGDGVYAQIWSSTLLDTNFEQVKDLRLQGGTRVVSDMGRCIGMPIRAVKSPAPKPDVLPGEFSVSATKKVKFSKGNLQLTLGADFTAAEWKFADNQYDCIGNAPGNTSFAVGTTIDLFGWSTKGNTVKWGVSTSTNSYDYITGTANKFNDWGENISDGISWYTLSGAEWSYLIGENGGRNTDLHKYPVTVCGHPRCMVVAPDDFKGTISDNYSVTEWATAETAGLVCLPSSGYREGTTIKDGDSYGGYWTGSIYASEDPDAQNLYLSTEGHGTSRTHCHYGLSVRLVTTYSDASSLEVTGEVCTNYNVTNGPKEYKVKSGSPWKLQYTLNGTDWVDAEVGKIIDGWISFDRVSGIASDQEVSVKATVTPATSQTSVTVNHNDNLRKASYRGQNSDIASQQRPYDLSMHDIYGNPTQCNTANCYVISGPGLYAFPIVYGNSIKNGADNKQAYAPTAAANSNTYLTPFKSATGGINSKYIDGVATAAPLWEDVADWALVGENDCKVLSPSQAAARGLTAGCGYVMFEVKADNLTPGNAVIAVKNSGGTILWSWHLWVTDEDLNTLAFTNTSGQVNHFMPVNLGWVDAENELTSPGYGGARLKIRFCQENGTAIDKCAERMANRQILSTSGKALYYQWGRKDPFIGNSTVVGEGIDYTHNASESSCTLQYSVQHPNHFIKNHNSGSPYRYQYYYDSNSATYRNLWDTTKSVYDPSPSGFHIPAQDPFDGLDGCERYAAINKGVILKISSSPDCYICFPASGNRDCESAEMISYESKGWCWTINHYNDNNGYAFCINVDNESVTSNGYGCNTYGMSIRCIAE